MPLYYYFFLLIALVVIFIVIRSLAFRKRNVSVELFFRALKNENSGHFEEAMVAYESALDEVKKVRFHKDLKNKIIEKLKVLHTLIEDTNSRRYIK